MNEIQTASHPQDNTVRKVGRISMDFSQSSKFPARMRAAFASCGSSPQSAVKRSILLRKLVKPLVFSFSPCFAKILPYPDICVGSATVGVAPAAKLPASCRRLLRWGTHRSPFVAAVTRG